MDGNHAGRMLQRTISLHQETPAVDQQAEIIIYPGAIAPGWNIVSSKGAEKGQK